MRNVAFRSSSRVVPGLPLPAQSDDPAEGGGSSSAAPQSNNQEVRVLSARSREFENKWWAKRGGRQDAGRGASRGAGALTGPSARQSDSAARKMLRGLQHHLALKQPLIDYPDAEAALRDSFKRHGIHV